MKQRTRKVFAALLLWLLAVVTVSAQDTVTYVYTDPQGTPLAEADAKGNITATFEYTPYGTYAPQGTSKPGANPSGPGYTGHVNDSETNLVYMQARYYDPLAGQFISVDPLTAVQGDVLAIGKYGYAQGNPIVNVDPDGRFPQNSDNLRGWQSIDQWCSVCLDAGQGAAPNPDNAKTLPGVTVTANTQAQGKTTVDIRYVPIGDQGYHHSFIVVTAPNGERAYVRGGPGGNNHGGLGQLLEDSSSNGRSYGNLTVEWGAYVPGTIDYTESPSAILPVLTTGQSPGAVMQKLVHFGAIVNASRITYHPLSTNSNAFAHQAVTVLGVSRPEAKVWAPGSDTPLTVLNPDRP